MGFYSSLTIVVVASIKDVASKTIASTLINEFGFRSSAIKFNEDFLYSRNNMLLAWINKEPVHASDLDLYFNPYAYVFLSRHSAESGIPSLTVHSTGNFGSAKIGGNDREVARSEASIMKNYMISLSKRKERIKDYAITLEATHHGPTSLKKPCIFVEIGSSEEKWRDTEAARVVCESLIESIEDGKMWEKVGIGFGGTHYPEKFNRLMIESDIAISYVVPKYALSLIDDSILEQMVQKSNSLVRYAIVDWKGLGKEKERIVKLAEDHGLEILRV